VEGSEEVKQYAIGLDEWIITVADTIARPWPSPSTLLKLGVPMLMVQRYRRVRHDMTVGLRQRVEQPQNQN
jgi:hypothetical protein